MFDLFCCCSNFYWLILLTIIFSIFYQYTIRTWSYFSERNIKIYRGIPLLGSIYSTVFGFESSAISFQKCYELFPFEKLIGIYESLGIPALLIRDPELVQRIFVNDKENFINVDLYHSINAQKLSKFYEKFVNNDLMTSVVKNTKQFTNSLNDYVVGTRMYNTKNFVSRFVCDVIAVNAFGIELNSVKDTNNEFYRTAVELTRLSYWENVKILIRHRFPMFKIKTITEINVNILQKYVYNEIVKRREEQQQQQQQSATKQNDLISLLIEGQTSQRENYLNDHEIACYCVSFFLDCFIPTTTALCFMFHELAVNPDIQTTLFNEINSIKNIDDDRSYDKSQYLDMILSETLRRWSLLPVSEQICIKSCTIENSNGSNVKINAGERTFIPIYAIQMDDNYFDGAEKFDPERFSSYNKDKIQHGTYLPFATTNTAIKTFSIAMIKSFAFHLLNDFIIDKNFRTQDPIELKSSLYQMEANRGFFIDLRKRH